jgi:transcriptional regulator with XRE-family HTH domain
MFLIEKMKARGLSIQDVADMVGIDQSAVWRWVNGKTSPNRLARARLAELGLYDNREIKNVPQMQRQSLELVSEQLVTIQQLLKDVAKSQEIEEALRWYVEHDDCTEDDPYYYEGKVRAMRLLGDRE